MSRILTLTLNPAIDQNVRVERLVRGEVHRALGMSHTAAGKGVNVAGCLADYGLRVGVTGLLGQDNAALFEAFFSRKGIDDRFVRVAGATRVNIKISDDQETTDINLPGLAASPEAVSEVVAHLEALDAGDIAVLSGSLPVGCASDLYADLTARLKRRGVHVVVDTSGAPLRAVLRAPVLPFVLKPNQAELSEALERPLNTTADIIAAAEALIVRGAGLVVVSQGAQGALFIDGTEVLRARLKVARVVSTVGAGDALVAGLVCGLHAAGPQAELERIARLSTAFAAASLAVEGANLPPAGVIGRLSDRVEIENIKTGTGAGI